MIKTVLLLLVTFIVVPIASYYFDEPLSDEQMRILWNCIYICVGIALACFVVSEVSGNYSQVDKIWSITPIIYSWYIANEGGMHPRLVLMAVLITIWGVRLTYNFSRRGAYSWKFWTGEEDYRWAVLRAKPEFQGWRWHVFNFFFVSFYQHGLLLLISLPALVALKGNEQPLGFVDFLLAALFIAFLVIETTADQQQWNYQQEKYRRIKAGEPLTGIYALGFTHTGLWKLMRHPNYMAEQAMWIIIYLFSVAATGSWLNWSITGCLLLMLLFQGSSDFSESISSGKYAEYKIYQERTGRFLPRFGK
jgi:steroid 5-alpha reductase family enzyme